MADVNIDDEALHFLLNDPTGPVAHDLERRALAVETDAKRRLSQPGTGRVYRRRGRTHQASAPGEPPAVDTGLLRASVKHTMGEDEQGLHADIGSDVKYAIYQELGTRRQAARPWLRPSLDAAKD